MYLDDDYCSAYSYYSPNVLGAPSEEDLPNGTPGPSVSAGGIAAIAIGSLVACGVAGFAVFIYYRRLHRFHKMMDDAASLRSTHSTSTAP